MKLSLLLSLFLIVSVSTAFSQEGDKVFLQQQLLLSKEKQAEIAKQQADIQRFENQKKQLAEQEKQLLQLRVKQKESELQKEYSRAQATRMQAKYQTALKDKYILKQETDIYQSRRWIYYLISISLLMLSAALVIYINQRKTRRLNEMITQQHQELKQISNVKDRLLTIVGHDMRSPLNMLLALSQTFQQENIPKVKMKTYMTQLESTLVHTSSLMDNLLHWATSQMQGYRPVIREVAIAEITSEVLLQQEIRAVYKGISLHHMVSEKFMVLCDEDMTAMVLRNLVGNAIKFTPQGGEIIVSSSKENGNTVVSVSDTGVGMNAALIEQFNNISFAGAESTHGTNKERGTGLGLLLCKNFIQLMNGSISTSPNPEGKGSVFKIILPHA